MMTVTQYSAAEMGGTQPGWLVATIGVLVGDFL